MTSSLQIIFIHIFFFFFITIALYFVMRVIAAQRRFPDNASRRKKLTRMVLTEAVFVFFFCKFFEKNNFNPEWYYLLCRIIVETSYSKLRMVRIVLSLLYSLAKPSFHIQVDSYFLIKLFVENLFVFLYNTSIRFIY